MSAPNVAPWPFRSSLILIAAALLLAIVSMAFEGWIGTALVAAAVLLAVYGGYTYWKVKQGRA